MSKNLANEMSVWEQRSYSLGGLGACPQQVKKGLMPVLRRSFFEDIDINVHTCMKKIPQMTKTYLKLTKDKNMRQTKKTKATKLKIAILITMISITTGCATNSRHKRLALKLVKNNNVILKQIKKERSSKKISPIIKDSPELLNAEKRLLTAINAVIDSNESLKKEFKRKTKKEVTNERK